MAWEKGLFHQFVKKVFACWLFLCVLGEIVDFHGTNRAHHREGDIRNDSNLNEIHPWYSGYVVEKMPEQWWNEFGKRSCHWLTRTFACWLFLWTRSMCLMFMICTYGYSVQIAGCDFDAPIPTIFVTVWRDTVSPLTYRFGFDCAIHMRVKHLFVQIIIPTGCVASAKEHTYQYRDSPANKHPRFGPGIQKNLSINQVFFICLSRVSHLQSIPMPNLS